MCALDCALAAAQNRTSQGQVRRCRFLHSTAICSEPPDRVLALGRRSVRSRSDKTVADNLSPASYRCGLE